MGPECADDARGEDAEHLFSETRRSLEENCKKRLEWLGDSLEACAERVRALKEAPLPLADDPDGLAAFGEVKDDVEFELELQFSRMRSAVAHVRKHFADPFEAETLARLQAAVRAGLAEAAEQARELADYKEKEAVGPLLAAQAAQDLLLHGRATRHHPAPRAPHRTAVPGTSAEEAVDEDLEVLLPRRVIRPVKERRESPNERETGCCSCGDAECPDLFEAADGAPQGMFLKDHHVVLAGTEKNVEACPHRKAMASKIIDGVFDRHSLLLRQRVKHLQAELDKHLNGSVAAQLAQQTRAFESLKEQHSILKAAHEAKSIEMMDQGGQLAVAKGKLAAREDAKVRVEKVTSLLDGFTKRYAACITFAVKVARTLATAVEESKDWLQTDGEPEKGAGDTDTDSNADEPATLTIPECVSQCDGASNATGASSDEMLAERMQSLVALDSRVRGLLQRTCERDAVDQLRALRSGLLACRAELAASCSKKPVPRPRRNTVSSLPSVTPSSAPSMSPAVRPTPPSPVPHGFGPSTVAKASIRNRPSLSACSPHLAARDSRLVLHLEQRSQPPDSPRH
ncbi:hypothetical protein DIPPA_13140 [Diplonema papillatum]|nr:hypothetical protein DIPPA_03738 [Diplonema papillatum]KAJ9457559.1 hypothetical protein DIPPA_13140 [Diplonema papillatum]